MNMPVFLATDLLFFLLLLALGAAVFHAARREPLRRPWRKVARNPAAMVSLVILLAFLALAVLDSIRFPPKAADGVAQYRNEPASLLDLWLAPLKSRTEKTYSAPLAAYAYAKEMIREPGGGERWDYPRLRHGGAHLADPERERLADILATGAKGLAEGFALWLLPLGLGLAGLYRRDRAGCMERLSALLRGQGEVPWRAIGLTVLALCLLGGAVGELGLKYHVLGTGKVGGDVLYQSLKSIRTGLLIGTLTTFATLPLALGFGILAGYFRGWVDDVIQYLYTTLNSIPGVLLIAAAMLVMQGYMARHEAEFASLALRADFRLLALCLILGMTSWTGLCRLLRAETLKLRELEYVQAARALGVGRGMILLRHILPNLFHLVLISVALDFSSLVLAEAVLSYINIGVDPSMDSWGNMINGARLEMARDPVVWWSLAAAFGFMFALVLSANLFADAVRDAFDPRRGD
ncbi:peptide/nickel transport system permease protein [Methylomagnum ishizawai]|uniref:Peptide/nickel transport system permease protein n=2 Tax=Methylomagnum ishizawai TaxID=1760988 RepID=A0A1Y6DBQ3_9GAMM|nr:peptide/nickel transport system permease protein [Methylomagnum ishizawai]